jgi:hypothetical protein
MPSRPSLDALRALTVLVLLLAATSTRAARLEGANDAILKRANFIDLSFAPAYQRSFRDPGSTGNYSLDIISKLTLIEREPEMIGNSDIVMWVNSGDKFPGLNSTSEFSSNAGVIFDVNDNPAESSNTSLLTLGLSQTLFYEQVEVGFGKFFPGQSFLSSSYLADNSNGFQGKMLSSNPAASFWESFGIGSLVGYWVDDWFFQAGFVDSKAGDNDLDFSSFKEGRYDYMAEATYSPPRQDESEITDLSLLVYHSSSHNGIRDETGMIFQFTHEFGGDAEFATFGRYTWKEGGSGSTPSGRANAVPLKHGGLLGGAWNRPFGLGSHQLAAAFFYGKPTHFKDSQGFDDEYGSEVYWKYQPVNWFHVTGDLQLLHTDDNRLEAVAGLRFNFHFVRSWLGFDFLAPVE